MCLLVVETESGFTRWTDTRSQVRKQAIITRENLGFHSLKALDGHVRSLEKAPFESADDAVTSPHPREQGGEAAPSAVQLLWGDTYHPGSKHHRMARQPTRRTRAPREGHRLPGVASRHTGLCTHGPSEQHWSHFPRRSHRAVCTLPLTGAGRPLLHSRARAQRWAERAPASVPPEPARALLPDQLRSLQLRPPSPGETFALTREHRPLESWPRWRRRIHTGREITRETRSLGAACVAQPTRRVFQGLKIPPALVTLRLTRALRVFWPSPRPRSEVWLQAPIRFAPASTPTPTCRPRPRARSGVVYAGGPLRKEGLLGGTCGARADVTGRTSDPLKVSQTQT